MIGTVAGKTITFFKMNDSLPIGSHCGTLDGTVTLNIQIKSGTYKVQ